jgi:phosphoribosylanthranilate isomerase
LAVSSRGSSSLVDPAQFLVKVCGITTIEDALLAVGKGANALGFNFYPRSKRFLAPEAAAEIIEQIPPGIANFGIVVLGEPFAEIPEDWSTFLQGVQLHRVADPSRVPAFRGRVLVAVGPDEIERFPGREVIVDTSWGRGEVADWEVLRKVRRSYILSGGLTAGNVGEAIRLLRPAGVDVCSGVESSPGRKDPEALVRFLDEVFQALESSQLIGNRGKE